MVAIYGEELLDKQEMQDEAARKTLWEELETGANVKLIDTYMKDQQVIVRFHPEEDLIGGVQSADLFDFQLRYVKVQ